MPNPEVLRIIKDLTDLTKDVYTSKETYGLFAAITLYVTAHVITINYQEKKKIESDKPNLALDLKDK